MSKTKARVLIIAIIVAGIVLLGGVTWVIVSSPIASDQQQTTPDDRDPSAQDHEQVRQDQRESISLHAATTITTWNPVDDTSRTDALQRASEYMTDKLQEQIIPAENPPTDIEWRSAEQYEAISIPEAEIVEDAHVHEHSDTGSAAYITVKVTWEWETPDGSTYSGDDITQPRYYFFSFNEEHLITDYTTRSN